MNKFTISPCNLLTLIKGYGNFQKHDIYLFEGEKPLGCCVLSLTRVPVPFLILPRVLISKCWLLDRTKIKEEVPLVFSLSVRLTWFGTDSRNDRWAAQLSMYYHSEDQSRDQNILFLWLYTHPTYWYSMTFYLTPFILYQNGKLFFVQI